MIEWCNLFNYWCDEVKDVIEETSAPICDFECRGCKECVEIGPM